MARRNIFEILDDNYNFDDEFARIYRRINNIRIYPNMTLEYFVDNYIIVNWKARKGFRTSTELLEKLDLHNINYMNFTTQDRLKWFEYSLNLIELFYYDKDYLNNPYIDKNNVDFDEINAIKRDIKICLESVGYEVKTFKDEQKVIIVQQNAYASSVAEFIDKDLSRQIFEYNRFDMKGEIDEKRDIIMNLYREYEKSEKELKNAPTTLYDDIKFLTNKFHIRHNNENDEFYKKLLELPKDEQEEWYDKTYDLLLLAFLTLDGNEIHKELDEFKKK